MIIHCLQKWANESHINSNELVCGIFKLLLRQYSGVKEVIFILFVLFFNNYYF